MKIVSKVWIISGVHRCGNIGIEFVDHGGGGLCVNYGRSAIAATIGLFSGTLKLGLSRRGQYSCGL